jgi:hypothetical protein
MYAALLLIEEGGREKRCANFWQALSACEGAFRTKGYAEVQRTIIRRVFIIAIILMGIGSILPVVALATSHLKPGTTRPGSSVPGNPPTTTPRKGKTPTTAISGPGFNNEGVSADGAATSANFDGSGFDYSNNALAAAGFASGTVVDVNGISFPWPTITAGVADNWVTSGQVITVGTSGTLWFLGSSTNGPSSGTGTITFTDNTTQSFTLALSDWTLNAGTSSPLAGNSIAVTTPYRNTTTGGRQTVNTYVFATSVALVAGKTTESVTLPTSANQGHLHVFAISGQSDWTEYMADSMRSGTNAAETTLTSANFPNLHVKWTTTGTDGISTQPVEANNTVYWGSWDGKLHATTVSGANAGEDQWAVALGQTNVSGCDPQIAGIANTPVIATVNGTPTIFVGDGGNQGGGDGNVYYYAINASTGSILWKTALGTIANGYFAWSSGTLYNGSIYVGLASYGDCPLVRGGLVKLNATTGAIQNEFFTEVSGCTGDSIWGSPTIDPATGDVFVVTGNPGSCSPDPYSESMMAFTSSNLSLISSWAVPQSQRGGDSDFGTTPVFFSATIGGTAYNLVGAINKNGYFYAFDRTNISGGPKWEEQVAPGGDCPQCGTADITPDVFANGTLYIGTGDVSLNGTSCAGSVSAVNPATGAYIWRHCLMSGPVLGALTYVNGVVIATQGSWINALDASNGNTIFRYQDTTSGAYYYGGVAIANGRMYAGNLDGNFVAFGL